MAEIEILEGRLQEMESEALEAFAKLIDEDASKYKLAVKRGELRLLKILREIEIPQIKRERTPQG